MKSVLPYCLHVSVDEIKTNAANGVQHNKNDTRLEWKANFDETRGTEKRYILYDLYM